MLPRLVIAAILIQLSWFLFTGLMSLFNALWLQHYTLITAPFQAAGGGDIIDIQRQPKCKRSKYRRHICFFGGSRWCSCSRNSAELWRILTLAMVAIGVIVSIVGSANPYCAQAIIVRAISNRANCTGGMDLTRYTKYWTTWWNLFIATYYVSAYCNIVCGWANICICSSKFAGNQCGR